MCNKDLMKKDWFNNLMKNNFSIIINLSNTSNIVNATVIVENLDLGRFEYPMVLDNNSWFTYDFTDTNAIGIYNFTINVTDNDGIEFEITADECNNINNSAPIRNITPYFHYFGLLDGKTSLDRAKNSFLAICES